MSETRNMPVLLSVIAMAILAVVIAVLTLGPAPPSGAPGSDKLHHLLAFAVLAFPLSAARPRLAPWVLLAIIGYGGLIELIQPHVGRQAEWADFVADVAGGVIGAAAGAGIGVWRARG